MAGAAELAAGLAFAALEVMDEQSRAQLFATTVAKRLELELNNDDREWLCDLFISAGHVGKADGLRRVEEVVDKALAKRNGA